MWNIVVFTLILLFFSFQAAYSAEIGSPQIRYKGIKYTLIFKQDNLFAIHQQQRLKGHLEERIGNFGHWKFLFNHASKGFEIIMNTKINKVIYQKNNIDAGGPFLKTISPNGLFIVFDYGTAPSLRIFEVRKADGVLIFKDSYFNKLIWDKNGLKYDYPEKQLPINLNAKTKNCAPLGSAYQIQGYIFDGRRKLKSSQPAAIVCGN